MGSFLLDSPHTTAKYLALVSTSTHPDKVGNRTKIINGICSDYRTKSYQKIGRIVRDDRSESVTARSYLDPGLYYPIPRRPEYRRHYPDTDDQFIFIKLFGYRSRTWEIAEGKVCDCISASCIRAKTNKFFAPSHNRHLHRRTSFLEAHHTATNVPARRINHVCRVSI